MRIGRKTQIRTLPAVVRRLIIRPAAAIRETVFPAKCMACGILFHPEFCGERADGNDPYFRLARVVCPSCASGLMLIEPPICTCCGKRFTSREGESHVCGDCIDSPRRFSRARSVGIYDGTLMALIHRYKYSGKIQLAKPLGRLLFDAFRRLREDRGVDLVVPVPLHLKKFRQRGFNQSYLLVREWPRLEPSVTVERKALFRKYPTKPQAGLGRKERLVNLKGAFTPGARNIIGDKHILLVDDVYTTGATANECAGVLLDAGARQVDVLTLCRA